MNPIVSAILGGTHDSDLDALATAVNTRLKHRREIAAAENRASIRPGNRVRVNGNVRPKYLAGCTGTITNMRGEKFVMDLDFRVRKFHTSITMPANLVTKIED